MLLHRGDASEEEGVGVVELHAVGQRIDETAVYSEIPTSHPKKLAIEDAVRETFGRLPGSWKVAIRRAQARADWWGFVEVDGPKRLHRILIVDDPDEIRPLLKESFPAPGDA